MLWNLGGGAELGVTPGGSHVRYAILAFVSCFARCSFWVLIDPTMESHLTDVVLMSLCASMVAYCLL